MLYFLFVDQFKRKHFFHNGVSRIPKPPDYATYCPVYLIGKFLEFYIAVGEF